MRPTRRLLTGLIAAAALMGTCAGALAAEGDMSIGQAKARVTVIEYASVTCTVCATWNAEVFPVLKTKYVDTGRVRYVFRELPTQPGPLAVAGFLVARCAGAKYFAVIDALMHAQKGLFASGDGRAWLLEGGAAAGLGLDQVKACLDDEKASEAFTTRLTKNLEEYEVTSTPTLLVDGKIVDGYDLASLEAAIVAAERTKRGM